MAKKDTIVGISAEQISLLRSFEARVSAGEETDPEIIQAIEAIQLAGKVVNTVMSGNQIDPVFFKQLVDVTRQKINPTKVREKPKRVKKKKKLKVKLKS